MVLVCYTPVYLPNVQVYEGKTTETNSDTLGELLRWKFYSTFKIVATGYTLTFFSNITPYAKICWTKKHCACATLNYKLVVH